MVKKIQKKEESIVRGKIDSKEYVPTVLSLLDEEENVVSDVQKEILQDEIDELSEIEEGQMNIAGVYIYDIGEKLEVKAYIRNGLSEKLMLKKIPLVITNSKSEILARQIFNLEVLGDLPAYSARPIKLYFDKKNLRVSSIDAEDWKIVFDADFTVTKQIKVRYEDLPEDIELGDKWVYDKFLDELPVLSEGEFSISTFSIGIEKDGNILVTSVMRNATNEPMKLGKLPVTVIDNNGRVIKSNMFKLDKFVVNPYKAKICNFSFPTGVRLEENLGLDDWSVSYQSVK